ncbi:hypothetical protein B4589_008040 [Halolamina sp. CBA1230]|nr:hypothetical protein B4589_008040 [Halolamina sp. CBA1230]
MGGTDTPEGTATETETGTQTDGTETETDGTDTETTTDGTTGATVQVSTHPDLGELLVDSEGMTLYMFDQDAQGAGESSCTGGCAGNWPPLTVDGDPEASDDVTAELSTFEREDGETQVAANGWPLYTFATDEEPGDANGQGANDVWWVLGPDGSPIRSGGTATPTETPSG